MLDKWYKQEDYHKDHGQGLDYYQVGLTLGVGDVGVFLNDSIGYIHNYRSWEILDNGPLRSTFRVNYDPYTFGGVTVTETKTISLDAGAQLSKIRVHVVHTAPKTLPMVAGITLRPTPGRLKMDEEKGILSYWEPQHGNDGTLGVACIFSTSDPVPMLQKYQHGLARLSVKSGDDLVYCTGGAWDKAGLITSGEVWVTYLEQQAAQLRNPVNITAEK